MLVKARRFSDCVEEVFATRVNYDVGDLLMIDRVGFAEVVKTNCDLDEIKEYKGGLEHGFTVCFNGRL